MSQTVARFGLAHASAAGWGGQSAAKRRIMLAEILAEVSTEALQGDTLESVLKRIVDCVIQRLPVTIASVILLNDNQTHFVQEVWSGEIGLELPSDLPWPVELGASGRCVRTGKAQLIVDVECDPDYVPGNSGVSSEYLVPITHRGRLHGVLNLESVDAGFFSAEVCAAFDAIATQIAGAIHLARVVGELEHANRKLRQLSMNDGLTGIANRRCFDDRLLEEWTAHAVDGRSLALLFVDVDCFKLLNDARGHLHGDECLRDLAAACSAMLPDGKDLVARYGGEEFALLMANCDMATAKRVAHRLRTCVEGMGMLHPSSPIARVVTVSIGVSATRPQPGTSEIVLIDTADRALYTAKRRGRNRIVSRSVRACSLDPAPSSVD
ncbi:MAG: diguanylate cyclase [Dokdonella sp.]|uniref:diguanylate cyclase domain-containing protein n=1 Tax=Dokdonella sp. TaxID=2291710 RepID=UPI003BAE3238